MPYSLLTLIHNIIETITGSTSSIHFSEFLHFSTGTGFINIPQQIGIKYSHFGVALLDKDAGYISSLENQFNNNAERINYSILQEWVDGRGRQPVTWATLVQVLEDIEMSSLADQIRKQKSTL